VPLEAILAKVEIESKGMIESVMIHQSETSAIDEAKVFVIISNKNRLRGLFNRFANPKNFDAGLTERLYEFDGRGMTDFKADQGIGLGENEIGG